MSCHRSPSLRRFLCLCGLLLLAAGCGDSAPKAYPVQGKVVFKGKGGPGSGLVGGRVRLQSMTDPTLMPVGEIEDGGSFSIGTRWKDKDLRGVPAGQYKVRVEPPGDDEDRRQRTVLDPKYRDFDKSNLTITVPHSGEFVLEVGPPGR